MRTDGTDVLYAKVEQGSIMFNMRIVFSEHAVLKIKQRKLSRVAIRQTIEHPDVITIGASGRERLLKKFAKNYLQVIVKRETAAIIVITAHWVAHPPKQD